MFAKLTLTLKWTINPCLTYEPVDTVPERVLPLFALNCGLNDLLVDEIPNDWQAEKGFVDGAMLERVITNLDECEFFISGPEPMVEAFKPILTGKGIEEKYIHQDWFPNYTEKY